MISRNIFSLQSVTKSNVYSLLIILLILGNKPSFQAQTSTNQCFENLACIDSLILNPRIAETIFSRALEQMNCDSSAYPNLLIGLGKAYILSGFYTSADSVITLVEECAHLTPIHKAEILSLKVSRDSKLGNFDQAEAFSRQDLQNNWLARDTARFVRALHNHALVKLHQNHLADAAQAFAAVNYLAERFNYHYLHSLSLGNSSSLQSLIRNYDRAEALLDQQKSLLIGVLSDSVGVAINYGNKAVIRMYRGGFDNNTLLLFDSALHYLGSKDDAFAAWIYNCQGYVYNRNYDLEVALSLHHKALAAANRASAAEERVRILSNLASDYYRLGLLDSAFVYQDSSLYYGKKLNNPNLLKGVYETQITIYREAGKLNEALNAMENYFAFRDSLNRLQIEAQVHEIEAKFENEQLRRENLEQRIELDRERIQKLGMRNILLVLTLIIIGIFIGSGVVISQVQKKREALRAQIRVLNNELQELQQNEKISLEKINKAIESQLGPITYVEFQVIELILISDGEITITEIANRLNVSKDAIKSRKKSIAKKLNILEGSKYLISKKVLEICSDKPSNN